MASKKEKNEKRKKMIIGIIVTIFLISSLAAVVLYRTDDNSDYDPNKFTLNLSNGDYTFSRKVDNQGIAYYDVSFNQDSFTAFFIPQQLSDIKIEQSSVDLLKNSIFYYISFDPEQEGLTYIDFIRFELANEFPNNKYFSEGVTKPSLTYPLPILDCNNATTEVPVIILKTSNVTQITSSENCITFEFLQYDVLRIRDLLVYSSRGIDIR